MEKLKNESLDEKAAMRVILQPVVDEEIAEFDKWNKIDHEYSPEFKRRIARIFQNDRLKRSGRRAAVYGRKIAVCFAVIVTLTLVACVSIKPIREKVAGAFVTWYEKRNDISYEVTDEVGVPMQPTYIPEGYEEVYRDEFETDLILSYENDEMLGYSFTRTKNHEGFEWRMDNEKRVMEEIVWRTGKAIYFRPIFEKAGHTMMWEENGYIYTVSSDVSKEAMIEFAEGVK